MTKILVLSDLHLEHRPAWSLPDVLPPFEIAVFAGDVAGSPAESVAYLARAPGLTGRPVIYVPGNHEFYHGVLEGRLADGRAACQGTNVHMLDRESVIVAGVRFIGAILWTDYALFGDPVSAQVACLRGLNDHHLIQTTAAGGERRFLPKHAMMRHEQDRAFIEDELARQFAGRTVVVTHHAPHPGSIHPRYAADLICAGFVSDLSVVILREQPDVWVHGHVHDFFDYAVGTTRVLCNPKGYGPTRSMPKLQNYRFAATMVVDI